MFGVDELMKESEDDAVDVDFAKFLGPTVGGEWQPEEEEEDKKGEKEVQWCSLSTLICLNIGTPKNHQFQLRNGKLMIFG